MRLSDIESLNELRKLEYVSVQDIIPIFTHIGIDTAVMTVYEIFNLFYDLTDKEEE